MSKGAADDREIVITRIFEAPRELVWKAFMEPDHVERWWGPRGFQTRVEKHDPVVGGRTRYVMVAPDGNEYPAEGTFKEIVPMEKFVSTDEFGEDYIEKTDIDLPEGMVITVTFEDEGTATRVTLSIMHPSVEERRKHEEMGVVLGWSSSFDCLDDVFKETVDIGSREIVIARTFDAPAELIWDAWTDPDKVVQWWGPEGFTTTTDSMDVREGGMWKHTMHGPDGTDYPNKKVYLEVLKPIRLVYKNSGNRGDGEGKGVFFRTTVTFVETDGKTELTLRMVFPTSEMREAVVRENNAIEGGKQTLARLAEFLQR